MAPPEQMTRVARAPHVRAGAGPPPPTAAAAPAGALEMMAVPPAPREGQGVV